MAWFERLETENDDLRSALSWAIERGEAELGLRLAEALRPFWYARGDYVEGRGWIARFLDALGELFSDQGDHVRAEKLYEEVLSLSREVGDALMLVDCLIKLGYVSLLRGDHRKAMTLGEEAVALSRQRGYAASLARALNCLGWAALPEGDQERAGDSFAQSLALYEELGDSATAAESLQGLACAAEARGEARRSARLFGAPEAAGYGHTPTQRALREPYLSAARSLTDEASWREALADGRSTTIEVAVSRTLEEVTKRGQ